MLLLANTSVPAFVEQQLGVTLPVWSCFYQVLVTEPVEPMPPHHLIGHDNRTLAMKATPDGRVMITGGWLGRWNAELGRAETIPEQVQGDLAEAVAVYPALHDSKSRRRTSAGRNPSAWTRYRSLIRSPARRTC